MLHSQIGAEMLELVVAAVRRLAAGGVLPRELAEQPLDAATQIDELGIDSLGKLNLLSELEDVAEVTLSEAMLVGRRTLGDLADMVLSVRSGW